jgi:predicted DNA binding CopG/RHH family protein
MKSEYDFSKSKPNPYAKKLKKQITIRLDEETINYFKKIATEKEIPYQSLINLYLKDCAKAQKQVLIEWV